MLSGRDKERSIWGANAGRLDVRTPPNELRECSFEGAPIFQGEQLFALGGDGVAQFSAALQRELFAILDHSQRDRGQQHRRGKRGHREGDATRNAEAGHTTQVRRVDRRA